jgi:hypothetical protein
VDFLSLSPRINISRFQASRKPTSLRCSPVYQGHRIKVLTASSRSDCVVLFVPAAADEEQTGSGYRVGRTGRQQVYRVTRESTPQSMICVAELARRAERCALQSNRRVRESRSAQRAEDRNSEARNAKNAFGVSGLSALRTLVWARMSMRPQRACNLILRADADATAARVGIGWSCGQQKTRKYRPPDRASSISPRNTSF